MGRLREWRDEGRIVRCDVRLDAITSVLWGRLTRVEGEAVELAAEDGRARFAFNPRAAVRFAEDDRVTPRWEGDDDFRMAIVAVLQEDDPRTRAEIEVVMFSTSLNRDDRLVK